MLKSRVTTKRKECITPRLRDEKLLKKEKKKPLKDLNVNEGKKGQKKEHRKRRPIGSK